jgi:short subunit dehydrogenase-like uncharacterized protein
VSVLVIYGANGYTGELIARRAAAEGVAAVLAGRMPAPPDQTTMPRDRLMRGATMAGS